jgi:hypothetical protein
MIGRILCSLGFHLKPPDVDGRFLWFCHRARCGRLQAPLPLGKRS